MEYRFYLSCYASQVCLVPFLMQQDNPLWMNARNTVRHILLYILMTYHFYKHPCDIWKHGFNVMFLNIWFFIGPLVTGSVLLTGAGNLNCDHIAHISESNMITGSILNVLQLCESKQAATVSIPALGTGKIMCFIFCIFLSTTTTSTYPHL